MSRHADNEVRFPRVSPSSRRWDRSVDPPMVLVARFGHLVIALSDRGLTVAVIDASRGHKLD